MGMRHQVFLIARLRSSDGTSAYRCVAAYHHQWCYAELAPLHMSRFLDLLSVEENAAVVREELLAMDGKYGHPSTDPTFPSCPCPYSLFLLGTAWRIGREADGELSFNQDSPLESGFLDARMGCWDGDNDDGLSFIDITDLSHPKYCFMLHGVSQPVSAYRYLGSYRRFLESRNPDAIFALLGCLSSFPLIPSEALREAWPQQHFDDGEPAVQQTTGTIQLYTDYYRLSSLTLCFCACAWARHLRQAGKLPVGHDDTVCGQSSTIQPLKITLLGGGLSSGSAGLMAFKLPGLSNISADDAFNILLEPEGLREALCNEEVFNFVVKTFPFDPSNDILCLGHSETREQKKADLRKLISLTGEDLGRLAHIMVIEALCEGFVDLSGFDLSIPTIVELFTQLQRYLTQLQQNHPPLQQVRSLSIARNPHVRLDDIPPLLETFPHIRRLNIMGCPAIDGDELIALMREAPAAFRTLEGLQHSSLLTHDKPPSYPIAFSFICTFYPRTLISVCLATFTLDQIFRALIDILLVLWAEHQRDTSPEVAVQIFFDSMMKNLIPMHMFKYQGPLITRTEFSYTGCEWEQPRRRPVISVPGPAHALVSDTPEGSWAFSLQWDTLWGGRSWGFVNYDTPISRDTDPFAPGGDYGMRAAGQVCDLRGFIRCMVDEGRPCPSPELVEKLEAVLYAKCGDVEGTLVCPLLRQEDALPAFYRLPDPSFIRPRYLGDTSRDFALDELILKMRAGPGSMYSRYMGDYPPFPDGFSQDEPDGELYDEPNDEPNDELGQVDSEPDEDADDGSDEDEVDDEYGRDYE